MTEKTLGQVAYEAKKPRTPGLWGLEAGYLRDEYERMADSVVSEYEARRWRAIETAPKHLYVDVIAAGRRIPNAKQSPTMTGGDNWRWWSNGAMILEEVTHWTPIPAPPKEVE